MQVGVVAIGRNEGQRLIRCLEALQAQPVRVVYVDSGSTDGSIQAARERGAAVVELDTSIPFTAARARNAGFRRLENDGALEFVQFVDGDCELVDSWLPEALSHLDQHEDVGMVAGRRRERFPDASPYNLLADMEWDTPIGDATEVGGDVLIRADVFRAAGGYDPTLIAGEDPELCLRVRREGFRVVRLDAEMTIHDADIHRFEQWWRRVVRAGHAYAESAHRYGSDSERYRVKELRSIVFWGGAVPAFAVGLAPITLGTSLFGGAAGYGLLWSRVYRHRRRRLDDRRRAALYATGTAIGKVAEMRGVLQYAYNAFIRRQQSELIEYK